MPQVSHVSHSQTPPGRAPAALRRPLIWAIAFLMIAVAALAGRHLANSDQHHSWNTSVLPPASVVLTARHTYTLSTPGGIVALARAQGTEQPSLDCTAVPSDGAENRTVGLTVTVENADSRLIHLIGRFTAPLSGRVRVGCDGVASVFVDDSDDASTDRVGLLSLVTALALLAGMSLAAAGAYDHARH